MLLFRVDFHKGRQTDVLRLVGFLIWRLLNNCISSISGFSVEISTVTTTAEYIQVNSEQRQEVG